MEKFNINDFIKSQKITTNYHEFNIHKILENKDTRDIRIYGKKVGMYISETRYCCGILEFGNFTVNKENGILLKYLLENMTRRSTCTVIKDSILDKILSKGKFIKLKPYKNPYTGNILITYFNK